MTPLFAVLGAGFGLGLVCIGAGWRRRTSLPVARRWFRSRPAHLAPLATGLVVGILVLAVSGWPVAGVIVGLATATLPRVLAHRKDRAWQVARTEAIAGWAEMLRDTLAAAAGLEQAIVASAEVAPLPIRSEVQELATRVEHDRLVPALEAFAEDLADPTGDLVVAALVLAARHEARRLAELLGTLARAARDQAAMELSVEAGRARIRTSTRVVVGSTLAFAAGLAVLEHGYLAPFGTPLGQLVLATIGGLFFVAFWWLSRMGRPETPARFLAPGTAGRPAP